MMDRIGPAQWNLERNHELQILNYLRKNGAASRTDIAEQLGLAKAAITILTKNLMLANILTERGEVPSAKQRRGRRKVNVAINENCRLAFGAVIERDFLHLGLTNLKGETLGQLTLSLSGCDYRGLLNQVTSGIQEMIDANCIPPAKILGAGLCLSKSGEMWIDGAALPEKLGRLKKDLSYALSFPLSAAPTMAGAMAAQYLFSRRNTDNLLLIRFGEESGSSVLADGHIFHGENFQAGGFAKLCRRRFSGFDLFCEDEGTKDGSNETLNRHLAEIIGLCASVLDSEEIVAFGSYLEHPKALAEVNRLLKENCVSHSVEAAFLTEKTLYQAACAVVIADVFYSLPL